jgi:hypothetical protein
MKGAEILIFKQTQRFRNFVSPILVPIATTFKYYFLYLILYYLIYLNKSV